MQTRVKYLLLASAVVLASLAAFIAFSDNARAQGEEKEVKTLEQMMQEAEAEEDIGPPPSRSEKASEKPGDEKAGDSGEVKSLEELMGEVEEEGSVETRDTTGVAAEAADEGPDDQAEAASAKSDDEEDGMPTGFFIGLAVLIVLMIVLGVPLYVLIGSITIYLLFVGGVFTEFRLLTAIIEQTRGLADQTVLLAIPFFVISGAVMTEGDIARRLINVAEALFGALSGGLAISTVVACAFFAAISGSSPVTVIAIGSIMFPALIDRGYPEKFSTGLVTSAGSLGILIPPSIPMIVYAIVDPTGMKDPIGYSIASAGGGDASVKDLFIAGLGPGILIAVVLSIYAMTVGMKDRVATSEFDASKLLVAMKEGVWALILPILILGGIYTGIFTPTQAAAVAVIYSVVVEFFIHRSLTIEDIPRVFTESAILMGSLLIIMALALGFNLYLDRAKIPEQAVEMILDMNLSIIMFLLIVNVLLLIVGFFMDILSAILILVPLLAPIGFGLGIHPLHLACIFIVNLEIGYLTPPIGLNLFVAGTLFKKGLGEVVRSVLPFLGMMLVCLMVITYIPTFSLGLVSISKGGDFFIGFPETPQHAPEDVEGAAPGEATSDINDDKPDEAKPDEPKQEGVQSLEDMMKEVEDEGGVGEPPSDDKGSGDDEVKSLDELMKEVEEEGAVEERE
jgi:C4-dicarboxylate transporter DctM subunit